MRSLAEFTVEAGQRVPFVLTWVPSYQDEPPRYDPDRALDETDRFWRDWIGRCTYDGRYGEAVRRSLLVLKALTYAPSGGITAAATTSLPEQIGGPRNWDYRYCWLRDAAFTLQALTGSGYTAEAKAWRDWLLRAVAGDPEDLQIMYSLTGRRRLPETELDWLDGYEGSRPVRVGNEAAGQFQLDVYGELLDGLHSARQAGLANDDDAWTLQTLLAEYLEGVWQRPDSSLWEVRGPQQHFVHSKVMAWVGSGPDDPHRRALRPARRRCSGGGPPARRHPRGGLCAGLRRRARHLHPVLRLERSGCRAAPHSARRLPAPDRSQSRGHRGCRAARAVRGRLRPALPHRRGPHLGPRHRRRATRRRGGLPRLQLLAGRRPRPHRPPRTRRESSSTGCSPCATTWGCSARSGTRRRNDTWATPRRPSATSGSSTPP